MPVITVQMTEGRTVAQKRELVRRFTEEFCRICAVSGGESPVLIPFGAHLGEPCLVQALHFFHNCENILSA